MARDCGTPADSQNAQATSAQRPFVPRANYSTAPRRSNDPQTPDNRLCYLCNKPGHFAASCPKNDDVPSARPSYTDSAHSKPVPINAAPKSDRKQLISALAAELGVEYSLVIPEFQPPPRPLFEEYSASSSPDSKYGQLDSSGHLDVSSIEVRNLNSVNLTFSKTGLDGQSPSALLSVGDPVNVSTSLTVPTTSLSAVISTSLISHDLVGLRERNSQEAEVSSTCPSSTIQSVRFPPSESNIPQVRFDCDSIPKDSETECAVIPPEISSSPTFEKFSASITPSPNTLKIPTLFQRATASFLSLIGRTPVELSKLESPAAVPPPPLQIRAQELLAPDEPLLYGKPPRNP